MCCTGTDVRPSYFLSPSAVAMRKGQDLFSDAIDFIGQVFYCAVVFYCGTVFRGRGELAYLSTGSMQVCVYVCMCICMYVSMYVCV